MVFNKFILPLGAILAFAFGLLVLPSPTQAHAPSGAIFTTVENGSIVNANVQYQDKRDVYLDGGPGQNAPSTAAGLDEGNYYFQVTDPSGKTLLSTDPVICREIHVNAAGVIDQYVSAGRTYNGNKQCGRDGKQFGKHDTGVDVDHNDVGAITIQLMPYDNTPNPGGVYKAWITFTADFAGDPSKVDNNCGNGCFHGFVPAHSKTDNYKFKGTKVLPPKVTFLKFYDANANGVRDAGEVGLSGWKYTVTDPLGVVSVVYTGSDGSYTIDPADEGSYTICESMPVEVGWAATTPLCQNVTVANGQVGSATFGNVYYDHFEGGLTIGYWKTHSSLGPAGPRDNTYDQLPIVLGIGSNGISAPEVNVTTEAIAVDTLTTAGDGCSGDCLTQLKTQELGAKLNCLKFAGFCNATLGLGGPTVQSILDDADELLDAVANGSISGEAAIKAIAEPLKTQLDSANNNEHTPSLWAISPVPGPYSFV